MTKAGFSFYSRDGVEAPHVHVSKGDAAAKAWRRPVRVEHAHGFSATELRRLEITTEHESVFLGRWNEHFSR